MNAAALGFALALAAVAAGWAGYGWRGVVLALSVVAFWLLLQFSRALRAMRNAAGRPLGHVDNAVMFNARLRPGMTLVQVIALTRSLGARVDDAEAGADEAYLWRDGGGDAVRVSLRGGRTVAHAIERASAGGAAAGDEAHRGQARE